MSSIGNRASHAALIAVVIMIGWPIHGLASVYKIGKGDVLTVEVYAGHNADREVPLSGNYVVNEDGSISRAWLPKMKIEGMSVVEAETEMQQVLKKYIIEPRVSIQVAEFRSRQVSVLGAVISPGTYSLAEDSSLLSALVKAGGRNQDSTSEVVVIRNGKDGSVERFEVSLTELLNGRSPKEIAKLRGSDLLYFPSKQEASSDGVIFVTGAVNKIGAFPYRAGYTALHAIIDANGFTKYAAPNRSRISRIVNGKEKVIRIRLGDVVKRGDKDKDVVLKPGDTINVPESIF